MVGTVLYSYALSTNLNPTYVDNYLVNSNSLNLQLASLNITSSGISNGFLKAVPNSTSTSSNNTTSYWTTQFTALHDITLSSLNFTIGNMNPNGNNKGVFLRSSLDNYASNLSGIFNIDGTCNYTFSSVNLEQGDSFTLRFYVYASNAANGAYINFSNVVLSTSTVCFNKGTQILCLNEKLNEEYIRIENLKKGDLVKTYLHGYRKIDLIGKNSLSNNPEQFSACMYKMEKTEENGLLEDLIVTGYHSVLVDELGEYKEENDKFFSKKTTPKIDDKYLLLSSVSNDFVKIENRDVFTYYNFALESEDENQSFGVWANGVLTECTSKSCFMKHSYKLL